MKLNDGRVISMISSKMPIINKSGKIIDTIGTFIDIADINDILTY